VTNFNRRAVMAAAALTPLVAHGALASAEEAKPAVPAKPEPPTLEEFFKEPTTYDAAISPNGEQLAVLSVVVTKQPVKEAAPQKGKTKEKDKKATDKPAEEEKRTAYLLLRSLSDLTAQPKVVKLGEQSINAIEWANDERLLVWVTYFKDDKGIPYGFFFGDFFIPMPIRRVVSIDLNGQNGVALFAGSKVMKRARDGAKVVDYMRSDPQKVLMQAWNPQSDDAALFQVDVYTGAATLLEDGGPLTDFWLTQDGVPMLRFDSNMRGTTGWIYGRAPGEKKWKLIRKARLNDKKKIEDFDVVGPTPKAGVFLVALRAEGRDCKIIRTFDITTETFGEVVAERAGREIDSAYVDENMKLVGAAFWDDRLNYQFADNNLAAHFRGVNTALGNACNVRLFDISLDHDRMLLNVSGPQEPGAFYVYDRKRRGMDLVGVHRPWLTPERLAATTAVKVKTRDGVEISAYLTTPVNAPAGPLPLLVMPHGGPEVRDYLDYDLTVQALAARGWLVLQANWRGSGGYGKAFAEQGHKQWNGRMQEDLEDAVAHVLASGRVDKKRVAIFGASYGGYTALMQAVRNPDIYKAVVSVAGDTELVETLAFSRREDGADSEAYTYWLKAIGDPKVDRAAMERASPALRAAEIKAPVLLIHGTEDTIVDPKQSKIMAKALQAAGKPYEVIDLKGEGHRGWSQETWTTVLKSGADFIAKHI
jgi:dipeptidyl aminopeptidase/acylaminoacyl peptidase